MSASTFSTMEARAVKKKMLATLVGCNYAGTENELQGCINDVHTMRTILLDRFGFAPGDITMLTDDHEPGAGVLPTGANVKRALADMVARAAPGDVLFFHFSGHGTEDNDVRGKETIVPCDFNLITDMDFRELVSRVPKGATFTMVADSCFSGGLFDQEKEQVGPGAAANRHHHRTSAPAGRFLPYATVLAHLSAASGMDASHHVGVHLVALFGDDASAKFHNHNRRHHGNGSHSGGHATRTDDGGILLSGSQKDETSADVPGDGSKKPCGAFTASLQAVLAADPAPMSNRELVRRARELLGEEGFEQHPCLYCSDANADAPFLGQHETRAKIEQLSKEGKKKMLATLVGCNYAGTENDLQGCINDVHAMRAILLDRFGFAPGDITMLTDDHKPGAGMLPTGANVKRVLSDMVAHAAPGAVLFFHFSGHGTEDNPVRGKEAIVPSDFNLITDVDFGELLDRVPQGATFTMVSDSCFSGGLFDQEKEQIGPGAAADRPHHRASAPAGRFLPYAAVHAHLSAASGMDASHHVADHLVALFGADASAKFHSHHRNSSNTAGGHVARVAHAGILLSGSQKDETSADVAGHGSKKPCGAFTDSLQTVLAAHPTPVSNRELLRRSREVLRKHRFSQHPCLYCSDANADAPFLGQQETRPRSNH